MKDKNLKWKILSAIFVLGIVTVLALSNGNILTKLKGQITNEKENKEESNEIATCNVTSENYITVSGNITQDSGSTGNALITIKEDNIVFTKEVMVSTDTYNQFKFTLPKGTYQMSITKEGYDEETDTIDKDKVYESISLHNNSVGEVIAEGQVGDNVYYKYYQTGLLSVTGSGNIWENSDLTFNFADPSSALSGNAQYYNGFILQDIVYKVMENNGVTLSDETKAMFNQSMPFGGFISQNVSKTEIVSQYGAMFQQYLDQLKVTECTVDSTSEDCQDLVGMMQMFGSKENTIKFFEILLDKQKLPMQTSLDLSKDITSLSTALVGTTMKDMDLSNISTFNLSNCNINNLTVQNIETIPSHYLTGVTYKNLIIPEGVKYISDYAFYTDIENKVSTTEPATLVLPSTLKTIGDWAFGSNNITAITFQEGLTSIGDTAFYHNDITSVILPKSLETLGQLAFLGNDISYIEINSNINSSEETVLDSVNFNLTAAFSFNYGDYPDNFNKDTYLLHKVNIKVNEGVTKIPNALFAYAGVATVSLPSTLQEIGAGVFLEDGISTINLPNAVSKIGAMAFNGNKLTELTIGANVEKIGKGAFIDNNISKVNLNSTKLTLASQLFAYNPYYSKQLYNNPAKLTIDLIVKDGVTTIPDSMFEGGSIEATAEDPTRVITINSASFPTSLTTIGEKSFYQTDLSKITLPNTLVSIGANAFENCSLTRLELSNKLTSLGNNAFKNNPFTYIYYDANIGTTYSDSNVPFLVELSNYEYKTFDTTTQKVDLKIGKDVNSIPSNLFYKANIGVGMNVIFEDGVESVPYFGSKNIKSITIPSSVTSIAQKAFESNPIATIDYGATNVVGSYSLVSGKYTSPFINNTGSGAALTIRSNVSSIPTNMFSGSTISSVTVDGTKTRFNSNWTGIGLNSSLMPSE